MLAPPPLPRTLPAALRDISSGKPEIRADAIRELVRYVDDAREEVVRALEKALSDADPRVRALAATALADTDGTEALAALLVTVEDEDACVRQMAISALGELGDARASERLRRALSDPRPEVRFQAVMAFPRVTARKEDALDAILVAMDDHDPLVVHIAVRMAEELAGDGRPHARVIERVKKLLKHDADTVRITSAILLAHAGDTSGRDLLVKAATGQLRDIEGEDEAAAIELCGELGLSAAKEGLARRAFRGFLGFGRDRYGWHARVALAQMGDSRAVREILGELGSWDKQRRTMAVAAVGRARISAARPTLTAMLGAPEKADPETVAEALRALDAQSAQ